VIAIGRAHGTRVQIALAPLGQCQAAACESVKTASSS
jgi:hypothetical protein